MEAKVLLRYIGYFFFPQPIRHDLLQDLARSAEPEEGSDRRRGSYCNVDLSCLVQHWQ